VDDNGVGVVGGITSATAVVIVAATFVDCGGVSEGNDVAGAEGSVSI
jgi:hypothetical protein